MLPRCSCMLTSVFVSRRTNSSRGPILIPFVPCFKWRIYFAACMFFTVSSDRVCFVIVLELDLIVNEAWSVDSLQLEQESSVLDAISSLSFTALLCLLRYVLLFVYLRSSVPLPCRLYVWFLCVPRLLLFVWAGLLFTLRSSSFISSLFLISYFSIVFLAM